MKKTLTFIAFIVLTSTLFAQGFATFIVDGSIVPANIKNVKNGNSLIEVLVSDDVDIKNVNFKYRLISGCELENEISNDFTNTQTITVKRNNGDTKKWDLMVKPLKPVSLPFELNFSKHNPSEWTTDVNGWAGIGVDTSKETVIRFGNSGVSFWIAFDEAPGKLVYELTPVSRDPVDFDGEFVVETSTNAKRWRTLHTFNKRRQFNESGIYEAELDKNVRYIRWTYYERNKLNINLNNIAVTAK